MLYLELQLISFVSFNFPTFFISYLLNPISLLLFQ